MQHEFGALTRYANGGAIAKDMSLSQLSPLAGIGSMSLNAMSGYSNAAGSPAINGTGNFSAEKLGDDITQHYKDNNTLRLGDNNYFKGSDGSTYMGWNEGDPGWMGGEAGHDAAPSQITHIRQLNNKVAADDVNGWVNAGYDKIFNPDGSFAGVSVNAPPTSEMADFLNFATTALALASGNPALAFAKSMGSQIAGGALGVLFGKNGQRPNMFGGTNQYQDNAVRDYQNMDRI